jgi:hypothetical protein
VAGVGDWAVWAEADEPERTAEPPEPGEVDESLEARRLSRWLKAMFGGTPKKPEPRDGSDEPAS